MGALIVSGAEAVPRSHVVQFYGGDERFFARSVARYLQEGLRAGDGLVVAATQEHALAFTRELRELGSDPDAAIVDGRLVILDANGTLRLFMVDGQPDSARFRAALAPVLRAVRSSATNGRLRVYGELVGVLWSTGHYSAALRLEGFWNQILDGGEFPLFCGYPIDVFANEFQHTSVAALLCDHTQLQPSVAQDELHRALAQVIETEFGAIEGGSLGHIAKTGDWRDAIPAAEATILALRQKYPDKADDIVSQARQIYHAR